MLAGESAIAVCGDGVDDAAARNSMSRYGQASQWFDSAQAMFESFKPEIVSVGAVYGHNGTMVAMALRHGAKVVSDKPIAATWKQFEELQSLAAESGAVVLTEFDLRVRPAFRAARAAVVRGAVGTPILVTSQKSYRFNTRPAWYANRIDYGGTVLWIASHGLDAAEFVSGRRIAEVTGVQGNLSRPSLGSFEDHVLLSFQFAGGGSGASHADFLRPGKAATHGDDRIRVAGTHGLVEVREDRCWLTTHESELHEITSEGGGRTIAQELWRALNGQSECFSTGESLRTAAMLLRCRDAADTRTWVRVGASPD